MHNFELWIDLYNRFRNVHAKSVIIAQAFGVECAKIAPRLGRKIAYHYPPLFTAPSRFYTPPLPLPKFPPPPYKIPYTCISIFTIYHQHLINHHILLSPVFYHYQHSRILLLPTSYILILPTSPFQAFQMLCITCFKSLPEPFPARAIARRTLEFSK